ncbi:hypothetical protein H4F47_11150 [Pectobacterium brasiliense]|uniref:hypothetical protein n=1 Tax=Pectobacterium brasiliense TaxID=180957 RepID=UPI001968B26A|nr:hypothetical protein [Pectobacterium brasiliense]MBN3043469.1 hypothetical protein [Pectobacterium brasiliense]
MSEITDLVVIEKSTALDVFKSSDSVEDIISKVEREVESFVADVNTTKGRKDIASMAYKVAQSKTYLDGLGKDLVAELKEVPKLIDANRKTVRDRLDALRDKVRQPLTEWEAEQERIKAVEEAKRAAEELAKQVELAHREALLDNYEYDRDLAERKAEAERQRIAHEEELKRQAAEQAKREAEEKAAEELAAAQKREADAIAAKARAELLAKQAQERAEQEKQEAIEAERRKAQEEADRIKREAEAKEAARLAEEKRIADDQAKREADVKHRKAVGTDIVKALTANTSITREQAIEVLTALKDNIIPHTRITY